MVIGGGPAGSTVAALLASRGFNVTVYEAQRFPRPHIGESLLPATIRALELSGAAEAVRKAGFTVKLGATMSWGKDDSLWSWYFRETNETQPHAYQVNRDEFDHILLNHASDCGASVLQQSRVERVHFDDGTAKGIYLDGRLIDADFVIDASGQYALTAKQNNLIDWDEDFRNLSVYRYFSGGKHLDNDASGNILVEATPDGWLWKIPLRDHVSSVGVVADRDRALEDIRESTTSAWFSQQIEKSKHVRTLLASADPIGTCVAVRDWSYQTKQFVGVRHCLIGDAACFIDPLFSTGVHLAIYSATLAAALVTTIFKNPPLADAARVAFDHDYRTQYRHFRELARLFYSSNRSVNSYFWEARRLTGETSYTPRNAFVRAVSGQTEVGYERTTLSHGVLPSSFTKSVNAIESRRVEIQEKIKERLNPSTQLRLATDVKVATKALLSENQYEEGLVIERPSLADVSVSPFVADIIQGVHESPDSIDGIVDGLLRRGWDEDIIASALKPCLNLLLVDEVLLFD